MSDEYIKTAEAFLRWLEVFKKNVSYREEFTDIEDDVIRWADYTETDLGEYDIEILVETIKSLQEI